MRRPLPRSKRMQDLHPILDAIKRRVILEGKPMHETEVQATKGFPGDARRAMRKAHQCYRTRTRLVKVDGGYLQLEPVPG